LTWDRAAWERGEGPSFGEYLRGGPDVILGERTWRTRDQVEEGRTPDGGRYKRVVDQAGHVVTEETTPSGRERRHVRINLGG